MPGPFFQYLSENLALDYPFEDGAPVALRELFADAWLSSDGPFTRVQVSDFDPVAGKCTLLDQDGNNFATLQTPTSTLTTSTVGAYKVFQWVKLSPDTTPATKEIVFRLVVPTNKLSLFPVTMSNAWLCQRTTMFRPSRVRRLAARLDDTNLIRLGDNVALEEYWNVSVSHIAGQNTRAIRPAGRISLAASPGSGAGQHPGCPASPSAILTINNTSANNLGNIMLTGDSCVRINLPSLTSVGPAIRPFTTYYAQVPPGALRIFGLCPACCDCQKDFGAAYEALTRVWDYAKNVGAVVNSVKISYDTLRSNLVSYILANQGLKLVCSARSIPGHAVTFSAGVYNNTGNTSTSILLEFTVTPTPAGNQDYVVKSGILKRSGNIITQQDPTIFGNVYSTTLPAIPKGGYSVYMFTVRWKPTTGTATSDVLATSGFSSASCYANAEILPPEEPHLD